MELWTCISLVNHSRAETATKLLLAS